MGADNNLLWEKLLRHRGHNVSIVSYGDVDDPADVCLECEDCDEVILDAEIYTICANDDDDRFFGIVRWCDADIEGLLESIGVEPTADNVEKVRCACINNHHFTDGMIEAGWETLELYARDALGL